jgi:predicted amidohydrolase YtcJ
MKMSKKLAIILGLGMAFVMNTKGVLCGEKANYVFKNAAVYTIDAANPQAQAIAITGKYITYVGTNEGVKAFVGDKTKVIDLHGQMLLPGFVESHIHPMLAMFAGGADLQFDSVPQVLASVKKWADAHPDAPVILGYGWRYTLFPTTGPTKAELDKLFPDRPVLLIAIDCHSAWVNSKALEIAGVNAKTPDPVPGFSIYQRDPKTGEPTGWVVEGPAEQAVKKRARNVSLFIFLSLNPGFSADKNHRLSAVIRGLPCVVRAIISILREGKHNITYR